MTAISKIDVWGDSILKGVVLDEAIGRYKLLKDNAVDTFSHCFQMNIKNHSHFGCTAPKAQMSLHKTLDSGLATDVVLLEFGGNDCDFNWREVSDDPTRDHRPNTELPVFVDTMRDMVRSLLSKGITPLLMSLPPIDSYRFFDWITRPADVDPARVLAFLGEKEYIYRHQERYSMAITRVALEEQVAFVDVREAFLKERRLNSLLCMDGIHPTEEGQLLIRDVFSTYYRESPHLIGGLR